LPSNKSTPTDDALERGLAEVDAEAEADADDAVSEGVLV
jgi:hypothetical protein